MDTVGVVGLGYVGLPLAVQAAEKGYRVVGVDRDARLVAQIYARISPFRGDDRFDAAFKNVTAANLAVTTAYHDLRKVRSIVVCVPTPTDHGVPDLSHVVHAAERIAENLRVGQLVSLESTVNPGVTRDIVLPILERRSGLKVGVDFYLAHCPERIDPGNKKYFVGNLNRVVGGITEACTAQALNFYRSIIDAKILPLQSTEEAEFVKSWENTHRNVMIALANSAAIISDAFGMDIARILDGLQSKVDQFGLSLAQPGIGPGGHCIPEDIHYVIRRARQSGIDTRFLDDAADLNDKMPHYAVFRLTEMLKQADEDLGTMHVALLGMAYKPDVADIRRSPAIEVAHQLVRHAGSVTIHDPYISDIKHGLTTVYRAASLEEALQGADIVFVATAHQQYREKLDAATLVRHGIRFVFDGRNALDKDTIMAAGIGYRGIGR